MRDWLQRLPPAGRVLTIVLLAAFGYLTWWWLGEQRATESETAEAPRQPDSYFRNLEIVRHDAQGRPEMQVQADYAEHYEDEAWVHLQDMRASGLEAGPDWRLTARYGRLDDDGEELQAWEDVVLSRRTGEGTGMRLETERLTVNTETEIAVTDEPVVISQGNGQMRGRGLWASLADDRLRLESNVEARYGK